MKKLMSLVIVAFMLFLTSCGKHEQIKNTDFRDVKWGMTMEEVENIEGTSIEPDFSTETNGNKYIDYAGVPVSDYSANLTYEFNNDYLFRAYYIFEIQNYDNLLKTYTSIYGNPKTKVDNENITTHTWKTKNTTIEMLLLDSNLNDSSVYVRYWETDYTSINNTDGI